MKIDAIVVGVELDGQVAALRLLERGHSVRIFARGAGSLHYAPGGVHLLGFGPGGEGDPIDAPLEGMAALDDRHPYRLVGESGVRQALDWFFATSQDPERPQYDHPHGYRARSPHLCAAQPSSEPRGTERSQGGCGSLLWPS